MADSVETVLDKDEATTLSADDILYLIKGSGSNRDKKVKLSTLRAWLQILTELTVDGEITVTGTGGSCTISNGSISFEGQSGGSTVSISLSADGLHLNGVTISNAVESGVVIAQINKTLECLLNLVVDGQATIRGKLKIEDEIDFNGPTIKKVSDSGAVGIAFSHFVKCLSDFYVNGDAVFNGAVNMEGGGTHSGTHTFQGTVNHTGTTNFNGGAVTNGKFTVKGALVLKDGIPSTLTAETAIYGATADVDLNNNSLAWSVGQELTIYNDANTTINVTFALNRRVAIGSKMCGKFVCINQTANNNQFAPVSVVSAI